MFRAKPSMKAIVVQLLVDLSATSIQMKKFFRFTIENKLLMQLDHQFIAFRCWQVAVGLLPATTRSLKNPSMSSAFVLFIGRITRQIHLK